MATTIQADTLGPYTVTIMDGWNATRESRAIYHPILGFSPTAVVSLRPARPRSGTMSLVVAEEWIANNIVLTVCAGLVCRLEDTDRPALNMNFVVVGDTTLELDDDTRDVWLITIDYQEVD